MTEEIIRTTDLRKTYDDGGVEVQALKGVNVSVEKGEFVSIVGPSGSGKTTLLNLISGLDRPTSGEVRIGGTEISTLSDDGMADLRNRNIGFIFQFHNLLPEFTALENVAMPQMIQGKSRKRAKERAESLLGRVGLSDRLRHTPKELSGGQNQRVAIARGLSNDPKIVIGDEATGNNDTETTDTIYELFRELNRDLDQTFITVTHDPGLAGRADRTIRLVDGEVEDAS